MYMYIYIYIYSDPQGSQPSARDLRALAAGGQAAEASFDRVTIYNYFKC